MRLVLIYTYNEQWISSEIVLPFEHESLESAYFELDEEIRKHEELTKSYPDDFVFCEHTLRRSAFYHYSHFLGKIVYTPPEVLTLDQWYERPRY